MSQPWQQQPNSGYGQQPPPPGQPPGGGYGQPPQQQPQPGYGYPQQQPGYGYPQQPGQAQPFGAPGGGYPAPTPPPPVNQQKNLLVALAVAAGAMVVTALLGGFLYKEVLADDVSEPPSIGAVAILVGIAVGLGPAFLAKGNPVAYALSGVLALLGSFLAHFWGFALVAGDDPATASAVEILFRYNKDIYDYLWKPFDDAFYYLMPVFGAAVAVGVGLVTQLVLKQRQPQPQPMPPAY